MCVCVCLCAVGVVTAGRALCVTSVYRTRAASTAHAWTSGSVSVRGIGEGYSVKKVTTDVTFLLFYCVCKHNETSGFLKSHDVF